jgi:hypothetical protein
MQESSQREPDCCSAEIGGGAMNARYKFSPRSLSSSHMSFQPTLTSNSK